MSYTKKLYNTLALRAAFIEGATSGEFAMSRIQAEKAAVAKYPIVRPTLGELPEIAEALRVPTLENAPRNSTGEDKAF